MRLVVIPVGVGHGFVTDGSADAYALGRRGMNGLVRRT